MTGFLGIKCSLLYVNCELLPLLLAALLIPAKKRRDHSNKKIIAAFIFTCNQSTSSPGKVKDRLALTYSWRCALVLLKVINNLIRKYSNAQDPLHSVFVKFCVYLSNRLAISAGSFPGFISRSHSVSLSSLLSENPEGGWRQISEGTSLLVVSSSELQQKILLVASR